MPSASIDVTSSSPAPRSTASRAQSTASRPRGVFPACVTTSPARASIAQTTACEPNSSASAVRIDGSSNAARLTATLSAPARSSDACVVEARDAAADRERDRQLGRGALDQLEDRPAALERRGDVEEDELVGAELRVARRELDRLAHLPQVDEVDALDDAAAGDVEAGDHTLLDHASAFSRSARPGEGAALGVELDAGDGALLDRCDDRGRRGRRRRRRPHRPPARPRSCARSRRPRRRGPRRAPTGCVTASVFQPMCGTRAAPHATHRSRRGAPALIPPSSLAPKSSCMPTQIPSTGRPAATRSRIASSRPCSASPRAALSTWPTPAITASGASRTSAGSTVTVGSAPARAKAEATERRLPAP